MPAPITAQFEELLRRAPSLSPLELLPTLRSMLEAYFRSELREAGRTWPGNLADAIHEYVELRRLSRVERHELHEVRVKANLVLHESYQPTRAEADKALVTVGALLGVAVAEPRREEPSAAPPQAVVVSTRRSEDGGAVRTVVVVDVDETNGLLLVEERSGDGVSSEAVLRVKPSAAFASLVRPSSKGRTLNLVDVARDGDLLVPRIVVVEPDYLVGVSAVSECVQQNGVNPRIALLSEFIPDEKSRPLLVGNLVNALLDRMLSEKREGRELDFRDFVKRELFQLAPLELSSMEDFESDPAVAELVAELERHFASIVQSAKQGFVAQAPGFDRREVDLEHVVLEPSFFSARYGIQGRLDLLHSAKSGYDVVELKSSKRVPRGATMAWGNHAAQARLYQLLLEDKQTEEERKGGQTSILYSAVPPGQSPLRHVKSTPEHAASLVVARNEIVARELAIAESRSPSEVAAALAPLLDPAQAGELPSFQLEKAARIASHWSEADEVERAWALESARFVARELRQAMLGGVDAPNAAVGMASLWRANDRAKKAAGRLLDGLTVVRNGDRLVLTLPETSGDDVEEAGANFREGDALLLYPRHRKGAPEGERLSPLQSQVLKCFLEKVEPLRLTVTFRNRLVSASYLEGHDLWALEPDTYDTFRRDWAGISAFLALPPERRRLLLGRMPPRRPPFDVPDDPVEAALAAPDWYLLSGPPGTGKTSGALRTMVARLIGEGKSVVVAAYTNRAVDEVCKQVEELGIDYLRVGTELGTDPKYRERLMDRAVEGLRRRREVKSRLTECNLYVGTVSSLLGKRELFSLKQFDVAIVDEASQILEVPMLTLLSRVPKFVLIGDHKQLPAVVAQAPESSAVSQEVAELLARELGMTNLRNSYFERMLARANGEWGWAHGTLRKQYRMHDDIMRLVNGRFYGGELECGDETRQRAALARDSWPAASDGVGMALRGRRVLFVAARRSAADRSFKECHEEARVAADVVEQICRGLGSGFKPATSVGVIASYRNQVALIRRELARRSASDAALVDLAGVTVDTVERFQGSERDVIVASVCCQFSWQLDQLVSANSPLGEETPIDRKLNVILTRAREQLVLVGNPEVLSRDDCYRGIIEEIRAADGFVGA